MGRQIKRKTKVQAIFQVTTDLHSEQPIWTNLTFLPEHLLLTEQGLYIPLSAISRVWISNDLADQLTCVSYKDSMGRTQTLTLRIKDEQGKLAGEHFKNLYRQLRANPLKPAYLSHSSSPAWLRARHLFTRLHGRKRRALSH